MLRSKPVLVVEKLALELVWISEAGVICRRLLTGHCGDWFQDCSCVGCDLRCGLRSEDVEKDESLAEVCFLFGRHDANMY